MEKEKGGGKEKKRGEKKKKGGGEPHPKVTSFFSQGTLQVLVYLSKPQM